MFCYNQKTTYEFAESLEFRRNIVLSVEHGTLSTLTSSDGVTWTGTYTPTANVEDTTNVVTVAATYRSEERRVGRGWRCWLGKLEAIRATVGGGDMRGTEKVKRST